MGGRPVTKLGWQTSSGKGSVKKSPLGNSMEQIASNKETGRTGKVAK